MEHLIPEQNDNFSNSLQMNDLYYKQFFIKKDTNPESNFILFKDIEMTIGNSDDINYEQYYFTINNLNTQGIVIVV